MARQLCALGRALSAVSLSAPGCVARTGAPLSLGSMRAFSAAVEDPPADGTAGSTQESLRETVERRLSADAKLEQGEPGEELLVEAAPARKKLTVVKRSEQIAEASSEFDSESDPTEPPRLHPLRLFYPGQTYKPEELDGEAPDALAYVHLPSQKTRQLYKRGKAANKELYETADFRNGRLLNGFVSEAGKLLPRRTNKVDAKVQRKIVRAVKTARMMAILPYTDRLPAFARGRKNPYS